MYRGEWEPVGGMTAGTVAMLLQAAYKDSAVGRKEVYEWFSCFRNYYLSLDDPNLVQSNLWPSERMKTSRKRMNLFWKTVTEQVNNLLMWLVCSGTPANEFLWENYKWKELHRNACLTCSWTIKSRLNQDACHELKEQLKVDPDHFLKVITGAGSWWLKIVQMWKRCRRKSMKVALKSITSQEFQHWFAQWKTRLDRFITSNRDHIEGDKNVKLSE